MAHAGEYDALRAEILDWQKRRAAVVMQTATVVAALLALATAVPDGVEWGLLSSTLLVLIAASVLFAVYAADAASRLGAYIEVVHEAREPGWETLSRRLGRGTFQHLNAVLGLVYVTLGLSAIAVPAMVAARLTQPWYGWVLLAGAACWFLTCVYALVFRSYGRRERYVRKLLEMGAGRDTRPSRPAGSDEEDLATSE